VIPSDKSSLYRQSGDLEERTDEQLNNILKTYAQGQIDSRIKGAEKLGLLYQSCMQPQSEIENQSVPRIKENLKLIEKIESRKDLANIVAAQHLQGMSSFFNLYASSNYNDSSKVIAFLDQGGISLPEKEYYFPVTERGKFILSAYKEHLAHFLQLAFKKIQMPITHLESERRAELILSIEKFLAQNSLSLEESQDSTKLNHVMSIAQFERIVPAFDWNTYWRKIGVEKKSLKQVNVSVPKFYLNLQKILNEAKDKPKLLAAIKIYLQWKFLMNTNSWISEELHNEFFQFWGKTLQGKKQMRPKWKACTYFVADAMSDTLAQAYVNTYPAQELIQKTQMMIDQIKAAFSQNLQTLSWIDETTKAAALVKLSVMKEKIGFPNKWINYDSLKVNESDPLLNHINAQIFLMHYELSKIGKPIDKSLWGMRVWEANAYYDPSLNEFVFPLGELLPPIMDLSASNGANFGALGATIGHELTHGYDADGSQFDDKGNIKQWWTPAVRENFENKAQCFVDQANKYQELPNLFINGAQTINENLADIGGLKLSYLAYKLNRLKETQELSYAGYNEDQQFFLAYAQSWCQKISDESLEENIKSDVHPPADFRVNAVLMNFSDFASTFSCAEGKNKLAPTNRCQIW
jgi:predicted metalloendopeptidase